MATDREQPDDVDDAKVAWLLTTTSNAPEPRSEFVRALAGRLDAQFAARSAAAGALPSLIDALQSPAGNGAAGMNGAASVNGKAGLNGAAQRAESNGHVESRPAPAASAGRDASVNARRWRRWPIVAATAASLFVAMIVWGPAYGWTAAIRAWVVGMVQQSGRDNSDGDAAPMAGGPARDVGTADVALTPRRDEAISVETIASVPPPAVAAERPVLAADSAKNVEPEQPETENAAPELPAWAPFDEPLPDDELSQRVDDGLTALWNARGVRPVGPSSDPEFMRRVYLDLTGRIPSVNEVHEFLNDRSPNKRERLVDRLLAHHDHATHLAAVWRGILLPDTADLTRLGGPIKFEEWMAAQFAVNKPYDQIVRDLLLVEGRVAESGPLQFYAAARMLPEELAGKTSRAFLGVRMECAECHDHPFDEVSQKDFWRFAAFFARISRPKGRMDVTSPVLQVRDSQQGDVMLPDSTEVVPPRLPAMAIDLDDAPDGPPLRQHLADWITSTSNGQFSRATVNRVWSHLFGRGLVDPVDDMRPANPPLAPDVLDVLSRDFAASHFDLRRLFRAIVLTDAYQRTSRSDESDPSRALHFAQMNIKSLTAEQLYDCITIATRPDGVGSVSVVNAAGVERFLDTNRQSFVAQFRAPPGQITDYPAGIPQALTLMHGGLIHTSTDLATSGLLKSLAAPFFTDQHRLETVFLATLSRYPEPAERDLIEQQMSSATTNEERKQILSDVLWALLNSGEFTFNH